MTARRLPSLIALLLAAVLAAGVAHAQAAAPTATHTGDAWVDARLADIDAYAATYHDAFVDELVRYHRAPRELVAELLARPGWTPGDVYFACSLAMEAGRPCRGVADLRPASDPRDWAAIARELGVAPGSAAYQDVKRAIAASYARWARPLPPDSAATAPHAAGRAEPASGPPAPAAATRRHPVPAH